jgi:glutathione peroxidase
MAAGTDSDTIYGFSCKNISGTMSSLSEYKGKVVLIVNVASKCGYTPQYQGLEELYQRYKDSGLVILGFPCNQFAGQEPGNSADIQSFCSLNFGVTFPLYAKINVNGKDADPLYDFLKQKAPGILGTKAIKWNFTKFLIDRTGKVQRRFATQTKPEELVETIEDLLKN